MLSVSKINSNISFRSYASSPETYSDYDARLAWLDMNKNACSSFVDGDISLRKALKEKWNNFWKIAFNEDPTIIVKAKMIEESLKKQALNKLVKETNTSSDRKLPYDLVA